MFALFKLIFTRAHSPVYRQQQAFAFHLSYFGLNLSMLQHRPYYALQDNFVNNTCMSGANGFTNF